MIKQVLFTLVLGASATLAQAQAVDAMKDSGKAAMEGTKEGVDNAKAAMSSEPNKSVDKAKAQVHKAKAHYHKHKAKAEAKAAT